MTNNTIANMPIGVQVIGNTSPDAQFPEGMEFLALNNTFYNNPIAVDLNAIAGAPATPQTRANIHFVAMNNIFSNSSTTVVRGAGMLDGSQMQFNLMWQNGAVLTQAAGLPAMHNPPPTGAAAFERNRRSAVPRRGNGNFQLLPGFGGDRRLADLAEPVAVERPVCVLGISGTLLPVVTQLLNANAGVRNQTPVSPTSRGSDPANPPTNMLTLPGYPDRGFIDLWVPTLATDPQGIPGPTTVPGSWVYKPALIRAGTQGVPGGGERDSLGYLRVDNPNRANVGLGDRPFFDIGAFEFRHSSRPTSSTSTRR